MQEPVVMHRRHGAASYAFDAEHNLFIRCGLLVGIGAACCVIPFETHRRSFPTEITVEALIANIKSARHIERVAMGEGVAHKKCLFSFGTKAKSLAQHRYSAMNGISTARYSAQVNHATTSLAANQFQFKRGRCK
jgi:hypothetical protein